VNLQKNKSYIILVLALLGIFHKSALAFAEPPLKWRVLVYMQADNNLYQYALLDLLEMQKSRPSDSFEVIVRLDTPGDEGIRDYQINHLAGTPNNLSLNSLNLDLIKTFSETHFHSQALNLGDFFKRYKSTSIEEQTMFVLWGHGEGFSSQSHAQFGGVALDDFPKSKLTITEIKKALQTYKSQIDLMIMDACLMQTLESAFELKNTVENYIASTQIQDFNGLPYTELLNFMGSELSRSARLSDSNESYYLAKKIPELYLKSMDQSKTQTETMSSINTSELNNVFIPTFNKTFKLINQYLAKNPFEKIMLKTTIQTLPFFLGNSRDISTFLIGMSSYFYKKDQVIYESLNDSLTSLSMTILNYAYGERYLDQNSYQYFRGYFRAFGMWIPSSKLEYSVRIKDFNSSSLYAGKDFEYWKAFLESLYNSSLLSI